MNHTPGPWEILEESENCMGEKIIRRSICCKSQYGLTQINLNSVNHKYPHAYANAKLLAAAPELLEACKDICSKAVKRQRGTSYIISADIVAKAKAAMSKATE